MRAKRTTEQEEFDAVRRGYAFCDRKMLRGKIAQLREIAASLSPEDLRHEELREMERMLDEPPPLMRSCGLVEVEDGRLLELASYPDFYPGLPGSVTVDLSELILASRTGNSEYVVTSSRSTPTGGAQVLIPAELRDEAMRLLYDEEHPR